MKQKKEPIVKDERTMLIDGKIAGELVLGMTCFIAVSAFVKASILDLDLKFLQKSISMTLLIEQMIVLEKSYIRLMVV